MSLDVPSRKPIVYRPCYRTIVKPGMKDCHFDSRMKTSRFDFLGTMTLTKYEMVAFRNASDERGDGGEEGGHGAKVAHGVEKRSII